MRPVGIILPWRVQKSSRFRLENPFAAAQRFLERNDLPLTYIDEVVRFIEKNTAPVDIGAQGEEYVDPYTGKEGYTGILWLFDGVV